MRNKNETIDFVSIKNSAEQGNTEAQRFVGKCYIEGSFGVEKDFTEALEWYSKAFGNDEEGQCKLASVYYDIYNEEEDEIEAGKWLKKAAECGNADAQYDLGLYYIYANQNLDSDCLNYGIKQDEKEGVKWLKKAAEQGEPYAQYELALCCFDGIGTEKNVEAAMDWFRKSAEQGKAGAQNKLGDIYFNGLIVEKSYTEAVKWYREAAKKGNSDAQYNLGKCYLNGYGVKKNSIQALEWFNKAAWNGNEEAQDYLTSDSAKKQQGVF